MHSRFGWVFGLVLVAVAVTLAGCPKSPEVGETQPAGPAVTSAPPPAPRPMGPGSEVRVAPPVGPREGTTVPGGTPGVGTAGPAQPPAGRGAVSSALKSIYFDYDKALLTDEARRTLNENAAWLKANAGSRLMIEGHCDERGTSEYNLALGDRRAKSVRDYLVAAGVDGGRLRTISYGKERPLDPGHDEAAWRANRRAQFTLSQ